MLSDLVPGGSHTYSKGDAPLNQPRLVRYKGGSGFTAEGRHFVDWRMGINNVLIGHCEDEIDDAACAAIRNGQGCSLPTDLEEQAAESVLQFFQRPDWMIKFCKNGSDANNAAIRLARAVTKRQHIAFDSTAPFFSTGDWFCAHQQRWAGTLDAERAYSHGFTLNNVESLERAFARRDLACVIMEIARTEYPDPSFLGALRYLCERDGTLLIVDEVVTGFRYEQLGLAHKWNVKADLITIGKGLGNGHSVSAVMGKREYMRRGADDVFLLSTTHGAEQHGLAAAVAVTKFYQDNDVISWLYGQGAGLTDIVNMAGRKAGVPISAYGDFWCRPMLSVKPEHQLDFYETVAEHGVMLSPKGWVCPCYRRTQGELEMTSDAIQKACAYVARHMAA